MCGRRLSHPLRLEKINTDEEVGIFSRTGYVEKESSRNSNAKS